MYKKENNVRQQKCLSISKYNSILEALDDDDFTAEDSEICIILSKRGQLYELNLIASLAWELVTNDKTTDDIISIFVETFDVSKSQAIQDIQNLIESFLHNKLIVNAY